jgi:lysophospholipase L1-like esterase
MSHRPGTYPAGDRATNQEDASMNPHLLTRPGPRWAAVAVTACLLTGLNIAPSAASPGAGLAGPGAGRPTTAQDGTWAASADRTGATLVDQTVRNVVRTNIGGSNLRVSLSNAFGSQAVTFGHVTVGVHQGGGAIEPGSDRQVTFGGSPSVTAPAGSEVLSDPLPGLLAAQQDLAISVYVQGSAGTVTGHNLAQQTSYVSTSGDHADDQTAVAFTTAVSNWYFLAGLVVSEPKQTATVAALGDSITDGYRSTPNTNSRWPDVLARDLLAGPKPKAMGVINEGISGNKILTDGAGVSAEARFDRDVLAQPSVKTVILLEGINDLSGGATADQVIAGDRQLIVRAHAAGTCIIGGTLTPFGNSSAQEKAAVVTVNDFIRTSGTFDGVIDFNAAVRDPANPDRMLPIYDSGDSLHPNDAGYHAMGNAAAADRAQLDCKR